MRMKEETAELDEFTFSQGTSDQESNGSGSYYIKQEPWNVGTWGWSTISRGLNSVEEGEGDEVGM